MEVHARRPRLRRAVGSVVPAVGAALVFLGSWALLHHFFWGRHQLIDTPKYERYGDSIRQGELPYRDFRLEYPPAAIVAFAAPEVSARIGDFGSYGHAFEKWMAACGVATVLFCALTLSAIGASRKRTLVALALIAISPLLLGTVMLSRFDLWPAALTAATFAALSRGRRSLAGLALGIAIAAKLYPLVLLPIVAIWVGKRAGHHAAIRFASLVGAVAAVAFLPFAILSPAKLAQSLGGQLSRPLQIESLGAAIVVTMHRIDGVRTVAHTDHGSQNLEGPLATHLAIASTVLGLALLGLVYVGFAAGRATSARLLVAASAALVVLVSFGKVFSPQYLIWLIPFLPLVAGRIGLFGSLVFAAAMALTQVWFPDRYRAYATSFRPLESDLVLGRDLLMSALAIVLTGALWRSRAGLPPIARPSATGRSMGSSRWPLSGAGRSRR